MENVLKKNKTWWKGKEQVEDDHWLVECMHVTCLLLFALWPQRNDGKALPLATRVQPGSRWVFATLVAMASIGGILVAAMTIACLRHQAHRLAAKKLGLEPEGGSFSHQEYQVRG